MATSKEWRNPNVVLYLLIQFLGYAGWSVWAYSLLSNLLYLITPSTLKIGMIEGFQGLLTAALAYPFGMLADKWRKHWVAKIGGVLELVACVVLLLSIHLHTIADNNVHLYWSLFGALMAYGAALGINSSALSTLYSNSLPTGSRSMWMTRLQIASSLGTIVGPICAIVVLKVAGDAWSLRDIVLPWSVSVGATALSVVLSLFMHDKWCLKEEIMGNVTDTYTDNDTVHFGCLRRTHIPWILLTNDLMFGLASGMTIKFFPLFFQQHVALTPIELQILFTLAFGAIAPLSYAAKWMADRIGRIQVCLLFPYVGLVFMLLIVVGKHHFWHIKWLMIAIYVGRASLMNSVSALHQSVLDDHIDSDKRARWNSLEFILTLGWSGSAVLGGWLVKRIDYQWTFVVTLICQFLATSFYWVLVPLVPRKEHSRNVDETEPLLVNVDPNDAFITSI